MWHIERAKGCSRTFISIRNIISRNNSCGMRSTRRKMWVFHTMFSRTSRQGETTLVEEILQVHSVDLVADPATTRGLFEGLSITDEKRNAVAELPDAANRPIAEIENEVSETLNAVVDTDVKTLSEQQHDAIHNLCQEQAAEIATLRAEIDHLERLRRPNHVAPVRSLLAEYRLPNPMRAIP